ncbi:MAG TPA: Rieske 2Fe-2S domain-containing protein [Candidatus Binatia bacterium]|nr:Rieske 2Fe-2S domain-containing protein [Candidatus Binatia bacterium]
MSAQSMYRAGRETVKNFTREENEWLTRVGPGTLMGNLFRQYWIPVTPAADIMEPGSKPIRVKLLGEDLVLFRALNGQIGMIGAFCAHRLAPLFFGRVEQDGLRCPYHGWKFAPDGKCLEMPNIPAEQQFTDEIHHPGYPAVERGGIIWTYMGPAKQAPSVPDLEFLRVSDSDRNYRLFYQECNYLQVLEGGIDPTHVMWLHSPYDLSDEELTVKQQPAQHLVANRSGARTPLDIEIADTAGGFTYGAKRPAGDGKTLWRVNQFIMPFYTMPPGGDQKQARAYIPVDDESCIKWQIKWYPSQSIKESSKESLRAPFAEEAYDPPTNSVPFGHIRTKAKRSNDYLMNWDVHKAKRFGIAGVNLQDVCVTENEGPTPILDRTKENLCPGDLSVIKARRMLLDAAHALRQSGAIPIGARDPSVYRVRGCSAVVSNDVDWVEGVREAVSVPPADKE